MEINLNKLVFGDKYDRIQLAKLWGYKSFHALSKGVITPKNTNIIILFVTKQKQESLPQYNDFIDNNTLYWEGETAHNSDSRIINSNLKKDQVHLFFRDTHHSPFIYYGEVKLSQYFLNRDRPSEFEFKILNLPSSDDIYTDLKNFFIGPNHLSETERESLVQSRIGQGKFRINLLKLWGSCAVTGVDNILLLKASHIKPWSISNNFERLDPLNGLLLTPTLDHLFDKGFISFSDDGNILISPQLEEINLQKLKINNHMKLRKKIDGIEIYLKFHRENVFIDK